MGWFEIGAMFWPLNHRGNQAFWIRISRVVCSNLTISLTNLGLFLFSWECIIWQGQVEVRSLCLSSELWPWSKWLYDATAVPLLVHCKASRGVPARWLVLSWLHLVFEGHYRCLLIWLVIWGRRRVLCPLNVFSGITQCVHKCLTFLVKKILICSFC